MGKFYTANDEFAQYLTEKGLIFHESNTELEETKPNKYYTDHKSGNQVKLSQKDNLITFLDKSGNFVDEDSAFTERQVEKFLAN